MKTSLPVGVYIRMTRGLFVGATGTIVASKDVFKDNSGELMYLVDFDEPQMYSATERVSKCWLYLYISETAEDGVILVTAPHLH